MHVEAEVDILRPDAPPTVRGRGDLRTSMRFLDIASGDWEWLVCPWQVNGEYLYVTASVPKGHSAISTEPAQIMAIHSRQHAITHFTAASLLTVGDAVTYATALMKDETETSGSSVPAGSVYAAVLGSSVRPTRPSMDEQMALSMPLTERMPQRYCIQNHLGVNVWYWRPAPGPHATLSKFKLTPGQSHQMLCEPHQERIIFSQTDGVQVWIAFASAAPHPSFVCMTAGACHEQGSLILNRGDVCAGKAYAVCHIAAGGGQLAANHQCDCESGGQVSVHNVFTAPERDGEPRGGCDACRTNKGHLHALQRVARELYRRADARASTRAAIPACNRAYSRRTTPYRTYHIRWPPPEPQR